MTRPPGRSFVSALVGATIVWSVLCGVILLSVWPLMPRTRLQWVLLIVFGPPLFVLGEHLGDQLFSKRVGLRISPRRFSILRILFGVLVMLAVYAVSIGIARVLGFPI